MSCLQFVTGASTMFCTFVFYPSILLLFILVLPCAIPHRGWWALYIKVLTLYHLDEFENLFPHILVYNKLNRRPESILLGNYPDDSC